MAQEPLSVFGQASNPGAYDLLQTIGSGGGILWRLRQENIVWFSGSGNPPALITGQINNNFYYDTSSGAVWQLQAGTWIKLASGATSPGGSNTQIQFNDTGTFGGSANLTFNKATFVLAQTGSHSITADQNSTTPLSALAFSTSFTSPVANMSAGSTLSPAPPLSVAQITLNASAGATLVLGTSDNTNNVQLINFFNTNATGFAHSVKALNVGGLDFIVTGPSSNDEIRLGGNAFSYSGNANSLFSMVARSGTSGFIINLTPGIVTQYAAVNTAGMGVPPIYAVTSQKTESAADTNVLTFTPPAAAGTYRISFVMSVSAANAATLGWTATWTDSNGNAQTPTNLALTQSGVAAPALTFTTSAAGNYYSSAIVDINSSAANIVVKLTFSGTSFSAKVSATIERIQ